MAEPIFQEKDRWEFNWAFDHLPAREQEAALQCLKLLNIQLDQKIAGQEEEDD